MLFVKLATGEEKTMVQLREENRHMSLPSSWTDNTLRALGVARVQKTSPPTSGDYEVVVRNGVEQVDGVWQERWTTQSMFTEYTDGEGNVVTVDVQKTAYDAQQNENLAAAARATRNKLLQETDFYACSDVTMPADITTYRQALRDVPQQAGFPNTITWPDKP